MHAKLTALLAAVTAVYAPAATFAQGPGFASRVPAASADAFAAPAAAPGVVMNLRQFEIPFSVDASGSRPVHVELFVSRDQGQRWELFARQPATGRHFQFSAPDDGHYWFATRTIDVAGNPHPPGNRIAPQLHVTVDTTRPQLSVKADVDAAGRVRVSYVYSDTAPAATEVQVQYMTDTNRTQWVPVAVPSQNVADRGDGTRHGEVEFQPAGEWRYLNVRVVAFDKAGNQADLIEQLERPRIAGRPALLASNVAPANPQAGAGATANQGYDGGYAMRTPPPAAAAEPAPRANPTAANPAVANSAVASQAGPSVGTGSAAAVGPVANPYAGDYADSGRNATSYRGLASASPQAAVPRLPPSQSVRAVPVSQPGGYSFAGSPPAHQTPALAPPINQFPPANSSQGQFQSAPSALPPSGAGEPLDSGPVPPSSAMRPISIETLPTPLGEPDTEYPTRSVPAAPPASGPLAGDSGYRTDRPDLQADPGQPYPPASATLPSISGSPGSLSGPAGNLSGPAAGGPAISIDESEIRQSRSRQFSLDYEVESVGSKGIDEVELWGSSDGGRTWSNWGADPDRQSPFDIETVNSGLYGFCIVVIGGNGLTSRRPQPGDEADIYIRVDDTAPEVHLTAARYGEGDEAGSLVIEYSYRDENPVSRPVTLSFSEHPDGPWTTIATGLENDGRYAWPADPRLPREIYLRIEGVDRAGNVGEQSRDTPVAVQGLAPRARIRGFQPIGQ